ncbi:GDP-mannose 4,6-dehydratase [Pararobbsia alpina]|uniref:GDP-mannose 4,6-dehydratase n=1 Tax=Pararobbsia alpina TaxID=621374 RepID=A0A6S7BKX7_9BURK|nr:GDP-mannose 4,6-dehydratase [Pararobbsia alpina]CAB3804038.1 GDP-mannose 4,6-dehydratase [Pararobbsia alpina]
MTEERGKFRSEKTALITGVSGQDGRYLAELLLEKGYSVIGLSRQSLLPTTLGIVDDRLELVACDLSDVQGLQHVIRSHRPDEIYNLGAQSRPGESWQRSLYTGEVTAMGAHRLYELALQECPKARIYQASSSEMFGRPLTFPQDESTLFSPVNPYAVAKVYAHQMATIYRRNFNLFIATGILFNHESPRRGMNFISQKIAYGAACLKLGLTNSPLLSELGEPIVKERKLWLGDLNIQRDWGFAGDYVHAMWLMLQEDVPQDYVIGTGILHSIRDMCEIAFSSVGLEWERYVETDERLLRPTETGATVANPSKARHRLGWIPTTSFSEMMHAMVAHHLYKMEKN